MKPTPLLRAMREGKLSLGSIITIGSPELLEVFGYCGYNYMIIDHMFTGIDWQLTANMVRAGQAYGVSSIIRVQTYPWGSRGKDNRLGAEVARSLGIGAASAMMSIGSIDEAEACLSVQHDAHHRRIWISPDVAEYEAGRARFMDPDDSFIVIPMLETAELIDDVDKLVKLDGLRAVALGIHDLCSAVGHPFDVDHPEVWKLVDKVVAATSAKGISTLVNVGYRYTTPDQMVARIGRLWDRGVRIICLQPPETLLQQLWKQIKAGADELVSQK
jgi:2-keto-3-deoxy-L-rhamnonate aldolase RhmA